MRRFLVKLAIFLTPLLLMLFLIEYRLRRIPNYDIVKRNYLERSINDVEVFVLGSSHAYCAINPRLLGSHAFSIAYYNQDTYYDTRIMLKYLPRAGKAKLVIVPISYFTFERMLEYNVADWRISYYYRFWDIPYETRKFRFEDYSLIALYGFEQTRVFLLKGFEEKVDETGGYAALQKQNTRAILNPRPTLDLQHRYMQTKFIPRNVQYLSEMFDALKARDIKAVIVTTPCFHTYYENMKPETYQRMQDEIQALCQKYQLEYYNYLKDPRFPMDDFYDSDHLNARGAEKFSQILRDEVVSKYVK